MTTHAHNHDHGPHGHHHHDHSHAAPARASTPPVLAPSLLRLGLAQRLMLAGGLVLIIWAMIIGVLV